MYVARRRWRFRTAALTMVGAVALTASGGGPAGATPLDGATPPDGTARSAVPARQDATVQAAAPIDRTSRSAVVAAYRQTYLPALNTPMGWTGNTANCVAGTISAAAQQATLSMVNYFRSMVDLSSVTFDPALSAKSQRAALMMSANSTLSHDPPSSWRCWSADGAEAAGASNLSLGNAGARAVDSQIRDRGSNNTAVGHRRWILYPPAITMGSGSTSNANSLWVFGEQSDELVLEPVAWPSAGFFPRELEPGGRWSFSLPEADLSAATVRVTGPTGATLATTVHRPVDGYGDPTLVWELGDLGEVAGRGDRSYRVDIGGIRDAPFTTHSYRVTLVDATVPVQYAPMGSLDDLVVSGDQVTIRGWAADRNLPSGGLQVRLRARIRLTDYAFPLVAWLPRPGLAGFGLPTAAGFETQLRFRPGTYQICADALDHNGDAQTATPTLIGCRDAVIK